MLELGFDKLKQTRFYQEVKQEGWQEGFQQGRQEVRDQMLPRVVPVLLQAGLSIAQIAQELQVSGEAVRQAAQHQN